MKLMREIEIKFKITNDITAKSIIEKVIATGGEIVKSKHQIDTIFVENSKIGYPIKEGDKVLRVREEKKDDMSKYLITLKVQRSVALESSEYEFGIDNNTECFKLFEALGFVNDVTVEKKRNEGKWNGYNICIDEVTDLGTFVELEVLIEDSADAKEIQEKMLKDLGILELSGEACMRTYDNQLRDLYGKWK